jgi:hypothetical protein
VPGPGVVDRDPAGARQAGAQHVPGLVAETVLAIDQQTHHLPLRDFDADRAQQRHQPRHGNLALMVLRQHEATQLRMAVTPSTSRRRESSGAIRGGVGAL